MLSNATAMCFEREVSPESVGCCVASVAVLACLSACQPEPESTFEPIECDIPQLFVERCGGDVCHGAGSSTAASLDLSSPGVEGRVANAPGNSCAGTLANPALPEQSLLYLKVADMPTCGARMPINGEPLDADELACMRDWISGLLPPGPDTAGSESSGCPGCVCEPGEEQACYAGPDGSQDVGICVGGMQSCAPDGSAWGPCEGQVTPRGESCSTPEVDEDCDGQTPACSQLWSRSFSEFGTTTSQNMRSVAVDSSGNIYSVGDFEGTVSFGGAPLVAVGEKSDIVIAKHDAFGNPVWSRSFGDSSNQYAAKIIVDADDDIIVLGRIFGNIDFGGGELDGEGAGDVVVAKFDADGNHLWSRSFGDLDPDRAERMAVDSQGNVLVTGTFTGEVDYGAGSFASHGMRDAFVLELDGATGAHVFSVQIGGPGDDYGFGIDTDADDNVVIAGRFEDWIEQLGGTLTSAGGTDVYVAKLDSNGAVMWSKSFGGSGDDGAHDLRVQPLTGNIVVLGAMAETVSFGGPELVSAGMRDMFLATLDPTGEHVWSAVFGDEADQFTSTYEVNTWLTLALDQNGGVIVGGSLIGGANFGGAELFAGDNPDVFFAKFTADGTFVGNRRFGGSGTDLALDIALADTGELVVAGRSFASSIDFGSAGVVNFEGGADGFIAKLAP